MLTSRTVPSIQKSVKGLANMSSCRKLPSLQVELLNHHPVRRVMQASFLGMRMFAVKSSLLVKQRCL